MAPLSHDPDANVFNFWSPPTRPDCPSNSQAVFVKWLLVWKRVILKPSLNQHHKFTSKRRKNHLNELLWSFHGQAQSQKRQIKLHCTGTRQCVHPVTPLSCSEKGATTLLCVWGRQIQYLTNREFNLGFGDRIFFFHLVLLLLSEGLYHLMYGAALSLRWHCDIPVGGSWEIWSRTKWFSLCSLDLLFHGGPSKGKTEVITRKA